MHREIKSLIITLGCIVLSFAAILNVLPKISPFVQKVDYCMAVVASPVAAAEKQKAKFSLDNVDNSADNTTTTSKKNDAKEAMNRITTKDSNDNSNIKETPADIAKLMNAEKIAIKHQKKKANTSEEKYVGGGTILSYEDMQVQSNIPSSFYKMNLKDLYKKGTDLSIKDKKKPTILIYHSHTTESYSLLDVGYYTTSFNQGCADTARNVVRVGDELVKWLEKAGFKVIHDTKIHDTDYNNSYNNSRKTVEKYLEQYPSIDITIDLHRDDITYSNGVKVKPTISVNGKKAARMMIIAGCQYNRVKHFPDWKDNLQFDIQIADAVNKQYKDLMRPILFGERKYNMDETHYSFLLEIGTDANTLDEACYSARLFGKAFGDMLNDKYVKD